MTPQDAGLMIAAGTAVGVVIGMFLGVIIGRHGGPELAAMIRMRTQRNLLRDRGYNLVTAIAKLRDKETGGAAYAQTAVNAWSTAVLQVEGDKP